MKNLYSKENNIFQSRAWADFQEAVGREVIELDGSFFYKGKLLKGKSYFFCPKGPVSVNSKQLTVNNFSKDKSLIFTRIEPSQALESENLKKVNKYSPLSQQYSPKQTLVLDLTKTEEELLAGMKSKHRYNTRLAEKKGLTVKSGYSKEEVDDFYKLSLEISERDKTYSPHPKEYYEKMAEILVPNNNLIILTVYLGKKPLSSLIILFYNDTTIYLHGASSNDLREFMPNHLAQWEAIKEAKKRDCKYYDFWGIAAERMPLTSHSGDLDANRERPESNRSWTSQDDNISWAIDENHPWAGITKFKMGFAKIGETGEVVKFPGAYDLILNQFWYKMFTLVNRVRKIMR